MFVCLISLDIGFQLCGLFFWAGDGGGHRTVIKSLSGKFEFCSTPPETT